MAQSDTALSKIQNAAARLGLPERVAKPPLMRLVTTDTIRGTRLERGHEFRNVGEPCWLNLNAASGLIVCECPARMPDPADTSKIIDVHLVMARHVASKLMRYININNIRAVDGWTKLDKLSDLNIYELVK